MILLYRSLYAYRIHTYIHTVYLNILIWYSWKWKVLEKWKARELLVCYAPCRNLERPDVVHILNQKVVFQLHFQPLFRPTHTHPHILLNPLSCFLTSFHVVYLSFFPFPCIRLIPLSAYRLFSIQMHWMCVRKYIYI